MAAGSLIISTSALVADPTFFARPRLRYLVALAPLLPVLAALTTPLIRPRYVPLSMTLGTLLGLAQTGVGLALGLVDLVLWSACAALGLAGWAFVEWRRVGVFAAGATSSRTGHGDIETDAARALGTAPEIDAFTTGAVACWLRCIHVTDRRTAEKTVTRLVPLAAAVREGMAAPPADVPIRRDETMARFAPQFGAPIVAAAWNARLLTLYGARLDGPFPEDPVARPDVANEKRPVADWRRFVVTYRSVRAWLGEHPEATAPNPVGESYSRRLADADPAAVLHEPTATMSRLLSALRADADDVDIIVETAGVVAEHARERGLDLAVHRAAPSFEEDVTLLTRRVHQGLSMTRPAPR